MRIEKLIEMLKTTDKNLILMVGVALSGKSTLINKIKDHIDTIISRDDIVLEMSNGLSYSEAFGKVNQKKVSKELKRRIDEASKSDGNIVIDMMNHRSKSRRSHLSKFDGFVKIALIVDCPTYEVLLERNEKRNREEGKFIPENVLSQMLSSYSSPTKDEGFDYIIYQK